MKKFLLKSLYWTVMTCAIIVLPICFVVRISWKMSEDVDDMLDYHFKKSGL